MRRDPAREGSIMIMRQLLQRADAQGHLAVEMGREGGREGGTEGEVEGGVGAGILAQAHQIIFPLLVLSLLDSLMASTT